MFVSTAKRLRVLKSSELSTLKREPTFFYLIIIIFVLSVKLVFMARAFLDL